jgi:uncharacterized repeat protein (TIGR03847 family)
MFERDTEFRPISHITVDAIGEPGQRTFMLQAWQGDRSVTLIIEKTHVQLLAVGIEDLLRELQNDHPDLGEASGDYSEPEMHIDPRSEPWFRVGELGLGYDERSDLVVLLAKELLEEGDDLSAARSVRFWAGRAQMRALGQWGAEIASRGRPLCPQCGEPLDPTGHFCPKRNGHQHRPS